MGQGRRLLYKSSFTSISDLGTPKNRNVVHRLFTAYIRVVEEKSFTHVYLLFSDEKVTDPNSKL
jgi:hypothetical protein